MSLPRTIMIGGKAYDWREIRALRKAQLEAHRAAQAGQPTLFPLVTDCRPESQRSASGRFSQPTLFDPPDNS